MSMLINYQNADNMGYLEKENILYGKRNGIYFITVASAKPMNYFIHCNVKFDADTDFKTILKERLHSFYNVNGVGYSKGGLNVEIDLTESKNLEEVLDVISETVNELNLVQFCTSSQREDNLGIYKLSNSVNIYNAETYEELNKVQGDKVNPKNAKFWKGIIVALGGALVGMAMSVILGAYVNIVASASGFVMAYLSFQGYQKFGGRPGTLVIIMIVVMNILLIFLGEYLQYVISLMDYSSMAFMEAAEIVYYALTYNIEVAQEFLINTGLSLIFFAAGAFSVIRAAIAGSKVIIDNRKLID